MIIKRIVHVVIPMKNKERVEISALFYMIGNIDFLLYKKGECRGDTPLPIKEGAAPKGTIGFHSGVALATFLNA